MYMYDIFNTDTVGIVDNYMEYQHGEFDRGYADDDDYDDYDDSMDGDFDSGMASAGFGTDESYFYSGSEE